MSKRKTVIELQAKPENIAVRRIVEKTKPVEYAPINPLFSKTGSDGATLEDEATDDKHNLEIKNIKNSQTNVAKKLKDTSQIIKNTTAQNLPETAKSGNQQSIDKNTTRKTETGDVESTSSPSNQGAFAQGERLRIFQTSTPVTRTVTVFQKAAIVVRGENGKQLVELLWRDQMNEKTKDIWDFLWKKFGQAAENNTNEIFIRKREILDGSGVKSDRTFISAIYTLEDMGLIEVRRLSGNKEGNLYILTDEGREEIDSYQQPSK